LLFVGARFGAARPLLRKKQEVLAKADLYAAPAISPGERVSRSGAFTSRSPAPSGTGRSGPGEGSLGKGALFSFIKGPLKKCILADMEKIRVEQQGMIGMVWFAAWLFTIGFLHLTFWKGVLAILLWPYYLGVMFAR
jgi:hypothetical protein